MLLNQACAYTFVWNLFNLPAGALPVSSVRADEQGYDGGAHARDSIARVARDAMRGSAGLPVGVQLVGLPWRDEACLGAMQALEDALGRVDPMPPGAMGVRRTE